jgi:hypothetical protein
LQPPKPAPPPINDGLPVKGRGSFILSNPTIDVQIGRDTARLPEDYWSRKRGPP